jgi:hypothetical protein
VTAEVVFASAFTHKSLSLPSHSSSFLTRLSNLWNAHCENHVSFSPGMLLGVIARGDSLDVMSSSGCCYTEKYTAVCRSAVRFCMLHDKIEEALLARYLSSEEQTAFCNQYISRVSVEKACEVAKTIKSNEVQAILYSAISHFALGEKKLLPAIVHACSIHDQHLRDSKLHSILAHRMVYKSGEEENAIGYSLSLSADARTSLLDSIGLGILARGDVCKAKQIANLIPKGRLFALLVELQQLPKPVFSEDVDDKLPTEVDIEVWKLLLQGKKNEAIDFYKKRLCNFEQNKEGLYEKYCHEYSFQSKLKKALNAVVSDSKKSESSDSSSSSTVPSHYASPQMSFQEFVRWKRAEPNCAVLALSSYFMSGGDVDAAFQAAVASNYQYTASAISNISSTLVDIGDIDRAMKMANVPHNDNKPLCIALGRQGKLKDVLVVVSRCSVEEKPRLLRSALSAAVDAGHLDEAGTLLDSLSSSIYEAICAEVAMAYMMFGQKGIENAERILQRGITNLTNHSVTEALYLLLLLGRSEFVVKKVVELSKNVDQKQACSELLCEVVEFFLATNNLPEAHRVSSLILDEKMKQNAQKAFLLDRGVSCLQSQTK